MTPYYQTPDGMVTIYHANYLDLITQGVVKPKDIALVHGDPPYAIGYDAAEVKRRNEYNVSHGLSNAPGKDFSGIMYDDNTPFDPLPILALGRKTVLWGANNYSDKLPACPGWIVWDKKRGGTVAVDMKMSDCELAWCNWGRMVKYIDHLWAGFRRDSEGNSFLYPTQKPEYVCGRVMDHAKLKAGELLFVPWMGSGPELVPAQQRGVRVIACDISEKACEIAVNARLKAVSRTDKRDVGPLFGGNS
jgi:DNA modification methylase